MKIYHPCPDFITKEAKQTCLDISIDSSEQAYLEFSIKIAEQAYLDAAMEEAKQAYLDYSIKYSEQAYLDAAMEEAEQAYTKKTYPVGAVIVNPDGEIISRGHNHVYSKDKEDFTAHAEIEAIREAGPKLMQKGNFENCTLYTTWEPCLMCCGAILLARIKHVIWVMDDDLHGGLRLLHKNKTLFNSPYYMQKLDNLKVSAVNDISAVNAPDLLKRMQAWMNDWNEEKQTVLSQRISR